MKKDGPPKRAVSSLPMLRQLLLALLGTRRSHRLARRERELGGVLPGALAFLGRDEHAELALLLHAHLGRNRTDRRVRCARQRLDRRYGAAEVVAARDVAGHDERRTEV